MLLQSLEVELWHLYKVQSVLAKLLVDLGEDGEACQLGIAGLFLDHRQRNTYGFLFLGFHATTSFASAVITQGTRWSSWLRTMSAGLPSWLSMISKISFPSLSQSAMMGLQSSS